MSSLRKKLARHGFESNDDYEYPVQCLLKSKADKIRALNIAGDSTRVKTAFANAVAQALEFPRVLYHDFSQRHAPEQEMILPASTDELGRSDPPIAALDQIASEACAYSEAQNTILIVDQLQAADFREHIRIYKFLREARWQFRDAVYYANPARFVLFLISEEPLYHSLRKSSFRVWVSARSARQIDYKPADFGLGEDAWDMMLRLGELFGRMGVTPTQSEYARILHDIHGQVRTVEGLRHSIYGWTEGVDRDLLYSDDIGPVMRTVLHEIERYVGLDEVELVDRAKD